MNFASTRRIKRGAPDFTGSQHLRGTSRKPWCTKRHTKHRRQQIAAMAKAK